MKTDDAQIRDLIERWALAVREGDLDAVLADHDPDIVMFDVPPPYEGVRGIDAYRRTWPPFFRWLREGAVFEIESLDVTVGADVAFAHALLRCGTKEEFADVPDNRLRLTLGLRKREGRWTVTHEHHSFPLADRSEQAQRAEREVRQVHERWFRDTAAKDLDGLMEPIAADVVSYEHVPPLQHLGSAAVREVCAAGLRAPSVTWTVPDLRIRVGDGLAVAWGLNRVEGETPEGERFEQWSRGTRVFERREGRWVLVHQHLSFPCDPVTGTAVRDGD